MKEYTDAILADDDGLDADDDDELTDDGLGDEDGDDKELDKE